MFRARSVFGTLLILCALGVCRQSVWATSLTVPDDAPTLQAAIDSRVDTVLVRPGLYSETLTVDVPVQVLATTSGALERPVLAGLVIRPLRGFGSGTFGFQDLHVTTKVLIVNDDERSELRFNRCTLASGIDDGSRSLSTKSIHLSRCDLVGTARLLVADLCEIDSCHVRGTAWVGEGGPYLRVRGCTFEGDGQGFAIAGSDLSGCAVEGNTIRNYLVGVGVEAGTGVIVDNEIEGCDDAGIRARGGITIASNVMRNCQGGGVILKTFDIGNIRDNLIEHCAGPGVWVGGQGSLEIVGNVINRCGGSGVEVDQGYYVSVKITGNTTCFGGGSGFVSRFPNGFSGTTLISHNIGFANRLYGLAWPLEDVATVGCNDWFANEAGTVSGRALSVDDFLVDPGFCNADSGDFRLRGNSPLIDRPGCALVGALGVGCAVTATVVQRFAAARVSRGILISWEVSEGSTAGEIWLERSETSEVGDWIRPPTERSADGRGVVELDRGVSADRGYSYRLAALEGDRVIVLTPPIVVESAATSGFDLFGVSPNPSNGPVRIAFSLDREAAVEVEIFDVQGRGVAVLARGVWPVGEHAVEWRGLREDGTQVPTGWYVVRYLFPGGRATQRLIRSF